MWFRRGESFNVCASVRVRVLCIVHLVCARVCVRIHMYVCVSFMHVCARLCVYTPMCVCVRVSIHVGEALRAGEESKGHVRGW